MYDFEVTKEFSTFTCPMFSRTCSPLCFNQKPELRSSCLLTRSHVFMSPGRGKSVSLGSGSAVTRRLPCLHRDLRTFRAPGRRAATPSGHAPGAAGRDCGLGCAGAWLYWLRPAHWLDSVWTQARALILVLVILSTIIILSTVIKICSCLCQLCGRTKRKMDKSTLKISLENT